MLIILSSRANLFVVIVYLNSQDCVGVSMYGVFSVRVQ